MNQYLLIFVNMTILYAQTYVKEILSTMNKCTYTLGYRILYYFIMYNLINYH